MGVRRLVLGVTLVPLLALSACGNNGVHDEGLDDLPKTDAATCLTSDEIGAAPVLVNADIDGNGEAADLVQFAAGADRCRNVLFARADGKRRGVQVTGDLPVDTEKTQAIRIPGRRGDLVMLTQEHPRGGFQVRLYGYADGRLEELTVAGQPIFPFVATDTPTDPMSATCTDGGFEITTARAHEPIGVVPAWDIDRTTYTVDGNTVTKGETTEIADNVLDKQLHRDHRQLTHSSLFANCRVGR